MGGFVGRFEPEELEDDPSLQELIDEELLLKKNSNAARKLSNESLNLLHEKYVSMTGKHADMNNVEKSNFWSGQLLLLQSYYLNADKLLVDDVSKDIKSLPINFHFG